MADSVLLIDDDVDVLRAVGALFEQAGYEVARELDAEAGLAAYDRLRPEVVLLDLHLPGMDGLEALARFKERNAAVILLTGHGDVETAVKAMQQGAENFLMKPADREHLLAAVARVADKVRLRRLNELLLLRSASGEGLESLGDSPAMRELARQIGLVALSERTPVLLQGEAGVGKSWLAALLHQLSPRAPGPYLEVTLWGKSAPALDQELFGSEQGGEQAPRERRQGLVEVASHGTLAFEEVADLPAELQPKLLRLLETRTFRRVGGVRDLASEVRVIAATSRDLDRLVEAGSFREDLAYRLNVMALRLPPLRERSREDRLALLLSIFNELQRIVSGSPAAVGPEALERLLNHPWPGNVREMRNVLERALILARGQPAIQVEHLPGEFRARPGPGDRRHTPMTIEELERIHIERTLRHHGGNRTRAAQELGISRATLINKIKRYAIQV
ncbi:MAG TPA: sigma-54 dependent transcriptional regulator [Gemmatimonadales bacterium]|jgi:DNA-binding NtrC family response regulator|nr:sigma-54 dependent transcriptional regulator [Gemmatimonadales bacterium]